MRRRPVMLVGALAASGLAAMFGSFPWRPAAARTAGWIGSDVNGMHYEVLLPADYRADTRYPVVLYLHQLAMGNYPEGLLKQVNQWFDAESFRASHPCIVVMPMLDQSADTSGTTINFGGKRQGQAGEDNAIAALKQVMARYPVDPRRIYVTGNSMGGMGTWQMLLDYNSQTGSREHIFAAGLPLAGRQGTVDPAVAAKALRTVPIWAVHGEKDREVSLDWDRAMAKLLSDSPTFHYTEVKGAGHEVWDIYYPRPDVWDWLFAQRSKA